jgi:predicted RNase H-like nuclease (RuvC/YqgF family)
MTDSNPAWPTPAETTNILRFLHRFADLMSNGANSENLLCAAKMLEAHIDQLAETKAHLQAERATSEASMEARKALETRIAAYANEILMLKANLVEQQSHSEIILSEMERRQSEFMQRAEEAEARLAALQESPPSVASGSIAVPLSTLRLAKAQFEALAQAFEKSGNIVSQVRCEASASSLDRAILDAGAADAVDDPDDTSQHAA